MTMHLLPIYYNDNNTKKKKQPFRRPGWQKAQAEHDKWLRSRGVHPDQLKHKARILVIRFQYIRMVSHFLLQIM